MAHQNTQMLRPENALKRAGEYTAIGDKQGALNLLHDVLSQRKVRTWQKTYESIMIRYLDLCIELKDHNRSKDGLHQYRNLSQAQAPGSLEVVINHFVDSAEARLKEAAENAEAAVLAAERVTDLEMGATPESIMLSTMTEEGERQRNERKLLVPWLIFVWESYRAVLDILRTSSKLEVVYHRTAERAFDFCFSFKRKVEFRRLCDMLRTHLGFLAKASMTPPNTNDRRLRGWDGWSDDSIEMHLTTRFKQLEITTKLELWSEAFRTVEDIHSIMHISPKKPPKSKVMANYYDKLIKIFWVSENYLFHAYAWLKFYALSDSFNTRMTSEERQKMADSVVLAALCIPDTNNTADGSSSSSFIEEKANIDSVASATLIKNQHMATLLGFHSNPNRRTLLIDLDHRKLLNLVSPYVAELYHNLESTFQPLDLVSKIVPLLKQLKESEDETYSEFTKPLNKLVVLKLLKQLSSVYYTVTVDHFLGLVKDLGYSHNDLEKFIVVAVKEKTLAVRIDHQTNCLKFGEVALESDYMRTQLTTLATQLLKVNDIIAPNVKDPQEIKDRALFFDKVRNTMETEHLNTLNRKNIIERRKEELEKREIELQKLSELQAIEDENKRLEAEKLRQEQERKERERKKREKMLAEYNLIHTKELLGKSGVDTSNIKTLTDRETDHLLSKAQEEAEAAAAAAEAKKVDQMKRLDYTVRAIRDSEIPLLATERVKFVEEKKAQFEKEEALASEKAKLQFEADTKLKSSVMTMLPFTKDFESSILKERKIQYDQYVQDKKQSVYDKRVSRARRLKFEKEEEEEFLREEERRKEYEAYEREQQRLAEEEAERQARANALEQAALAREKAETEAAAMKKREQMLEEAKLIKAQRESEAAAAATSSRTSSQTSTISPSEGKWRPRSMMGSQGPSSSSSSSGPSGDTGGSWRRSNNDNGPPTSSSFGGRMGGGGGGRSLSSLDSDNGDGGGRWARNSGGGGSRRETDRREPDRSESGRWRK
jgi:translation initiation factor 3 subunit A